MNKYEQLIEFIINEQEDKARELFHNIVVEKSREIYESLIDESDLQEVGGNDVEEMVDEITMDEEGLQEEGMDDEEFEVEVRSFAENIALMPTRGLGLTKKAVNASFTHNLSEQLIVSINTIQNINRDDISL
jgi:hypothetical protein